MVRIYPVIIDPGKRAVNYPMVNVSFTTLRVIGEPFAFVISLRRQAFTHKVGRRRCVSG
jgi:hypothetical protein